MNLSTLVIKYILHKGVQLKQNNQYVGDENINDYCTTVKYDLSKAVELFGNAVIKESPNQYRMYAFKFKQTRYKSCILADGLDSIEVGKPINFLIIENPIKDGLPLILYHEPA